MVRIEFCHNFCQCFLEISLQSTADASAVDFSDFNARFLEEAAVNTDLAEFIFNEHNFFSCKYIIQQFLYQCGFAGSEETGYNIYLCHIFTFFRASILYTRRQLFHFLCFAALFLFIPFDMKIDEFYSGIINCKRLRKR